MPPTLEAGHNKRQSLYGSYNRTNSPDSNFFERRWPCFIDQDQICKPRFRLLVWDLRWPVSATQHFFKFWFCNFLYCFFKLSFSFLQVFILFLQVLLIYCVAHTDLVFYAGSGCVLGDRNAVILLLLVSALLLLCLTRTKVILAIFYRVAELARQ